MPDASSTTIVEAGPVRVTNRTRDPLSLPAISPLADPQILGPYMSLVIDGSAFATAARERDGSITRSNSTTPPPMFEIRNDTDAPLLIRATTGLDDLLLEPFAAIRVSYERLRGLDHELWVRANLIAIDTVPLPTSQRSAFVGITALALGAVGMAAVILGIGSPVAVTVAAVILVVVLATLAGSSEAIPVERFGTAAADPVSRLLVALLVLAAGVMFPAGVVFYFGSISEAESPYTVDQLARALQLLLIVVASLVPGMLYVLFTRQKVAGLRELFFRDVVRLDPGVATLREAKIKYGPVVDEVYGARDRAIPFLSAGLPIMLSTLLIAFGWVLTLLPIGKFVSKDPGDLYVLFQPRVAPLVFGFLGTYFFAISMLFRRYVSTDLSPKAYTHITVRLLITTTLIWVVFRDQLLHETDPAKLGLQIALAWAIGAVPEAAISLIQEAVGSVVSVFKERHPVTQLDGMTFWDRYRLVEESIENIENLAHHNLFDLMLRTRIPTARLVDAVDQAILYLHTVDLAATPESPGELRSALRKCGIRTVTDLQLAFSEVSADQRQAVLSDEQWRRVQVVLRVIADDEWVSHLNKWRRRSRSAPPRATSPEEFYATARAAA